MKRFVSILLLITMAFASCSLSAGLAESVAESELIDTCQFVGSGEIAAEIEQKHADGTADDFDNLVMDAMDGAMAAGLENIGFHAVSIQVLEEGGLRIILAAGWETERCLYAVLRFTPCSIGAYVGEKPDDITQMPASSYAISLRTPGADFYENAGQVLQSQVAVTEQHAQALLSLPTLSGFYGKFPKNKTYDVYRGPGKEYGRSAKGKAAVSTNDDIMVYGVRGDWMLISYQISGNHVRYGWISTDRLPDYAVADCPELVFPGDDGTDYVYATITDATFMTDLEAITDTIVSQVGLGASVHCLAARPGWILVEMYRTDGHYIGFVEQKYVAMNHGCSFRVQLSFPENASHSADDIRGAARSVAEYYKAHAPGHTLLSLSYSAVENRPENANWPTDVPDGIEWMKFYGTARSISYYDFEIAGPDCRAEDLVFHVWREPGGEWIGGMGGYK